MSTPKFTHLHVHSDFSLLDGAARIDRLVDKVKAQGGTSVAVTDHGNLFGAVQFYKTARAAGIKPIIGCEVYMAPGDRRDRKSDGGMKEASNHLLLLAENLTGYHNLLKLCTRAFREGFYYRPRIDKEILREHHQGLICTSTCLGGEIPQALLADRRRAAEDFAKTYLDIFGEENFFIELQDHGLKEQQLTNPELADLARKLGIGIVATNDVHYLEAEDYEAHEVLCCISTGKKLEDKDRLSFSRNEFYLKTPEQMHELFRPWPQAVENTVRIAERCSVELDLKTRHAPVYKLPDARSDDDYLRELVYKMAPAKYAEITDEIRERIDYELGVIASKGFSSYFLIVWDFVNYARSEGIPCGGRGSACSTVVGYCLGLSSPDPLRYELYFERFMDPDRDEMPDIDMDMCQNGRERVIEYVREKYGHVAQIVTFGTLKAKAAIKDVGRVLGLGFEETNALTKLVPKDLHVTIDKALEVPELKKLYDSNQQIRRVMDISRRLEDMNRQIGVHAAAVVIADQPLENFVPLCHPAKSQQLITQYDGPCVEACGLLKMDFLGLRTLTIVERARQLAEKRLGQPLDLDALDFADPKVYELYTRGETLGTFQFESGGMVNVLLKMRPSRIEDLIAANALFRPGPMKYIDEYVARKHGKEWSTPHAIMTDVLRETYGIMVYQEQISRLVNRLGGIELKKAFRLAKAISKKKTSIIESMREPFLQGTAEKGVARATAEQIFEDILEFGKYAFNKAHSTGYALLAYKTAWLKVHHPVEYMAALLTFEMVDQEKLSTYLQEARRMGITISPPDINTSDADFTITTSAGQPQIRFGLTAVKGIGEKAVEAIITARRAGGPFRSIYDFCERVDSGAVNRGAMEALIKCGAFDSTGAMRAGLMLALDGALRHGSQATAIRKAGQMALFGAPGAANDLPEPPIPNVQWSDAEMLAFEKETLGYYVTSHPLTSHQAVLLKYSTGRTADLGKSREGHPITLGGIITQIRTLVTKGGRRAGSRMGILSVEDFSGQAELVLFSEVFGKHEAELALDRVAFFKGQVDRSREKPQVVVSQVIPIEQAAEKLAR